MRVGVIIISLLLSSAAWACNSCMTYDYNGVQTDSYVGVFYTHRVHQGLNTIASSSSFFAPSNAKLAHGLGGGSNLIKLESDTDYEVFRTIDLRLNWEVKPWLNLMVSLPYSSTDDYYGRTLDEKGFVSDTLFREKGVGDLFVSALLVKKKEVGARKMIFRGGLGFYLPTGKFKLIDNDGEFIDPSHQPGRGSVNVLLQAQTALWWYSKWGVLASANYLFSTQSKKSSGLKTALNDQFQYRFGNQLNVNVQAVRKFIVGEFAVMPKLGLYYENVENDKLNQIIMEDTGGSMVFAPVGFDINWKKITLQTNMFLPVWESLNGEQLGNAGILQTGILYGF